MAGDFYAGQLVKGTITNMATNEEIELLFNPTQLQKSVNVNYAEHKTIGGSHDHLQYLNTGSASMPLELFFSLPAYVDLHRGAGTGRLGDAARKRILQDFEDLRSSFHEFLYPVGRASDPFTRAPPTLLLQWPTTLALEALVVGQYQETDTNFNLDSVPTHFRITLPLREERRWRLTSSQARKIGWKRHGVGA
jgi:hypothetical protein